MAKVSRETSAVNARIVYWGIEGAGKSENLRRAHAKLRPDHRGDIRVVPSRLDPTVTYEELSILLGEVAGIKTQIEMVAVPGGREQGPMRKQLLDQVDGVVLVVDAAAPVEDNLASQEELREALAAYGRRLEDVPFVLQYNKRDVANPYALDDLHRKLDPGDAPVFEAVATEGTGVLQTLSIVSKRVIRNLRDHAPDVTPRPTAGDTLERMEAALASAGSEADAAALDVAAGDAEALLETSFPEFSGPEGARLGPDVSIVSVGEASRVGERSVRIPLVLSDPEGGTSTLVLTVQLDALVKGDSG